MRPRIAVLGAGAIGGYYGALLAKSGCDVTLIDGWAEHVEAIRARGMRVSDLTGELEETVPVRALHVNDVHALARERPVDVCILATKSYDTIWAVTMIRPYLAPDGFVVSMQNGLNEEAIAAVAGWGRTVGCVVMISAELIGPGHSLRTMGHQQAPLVEFRFGELHGRLTARVEALAEMTRAFDGAGLTSNLWGERWSKLCINAMHNGISAITGLNGRDRESLAEVREAELLIGSETVSVGRALGYDFDHVGRYPAADLMRFGDGDLKVREEAHAWLVSGSIGAPRSNRQRPSLAQDIAKGRRTEIDFLNGYVVDRAAAIGLKAPANAAIARLVNRLERGEITPDVCHVETVAAEIAAAA